MEQRALQPAWPLGPSSEGQASKKVSPRHHFLVKAVSKTILLGSDRKNSSQKSQKLVRLGDQTRRLRLIAYPAAAGSLRRPVQRQGINTTKGQGKSIDRDVLPAARRSVQKKQPRAFAGRSCTSVTVKMFTLGGATNARGDPRLSTRMTTHFPNYGMAYLGNSASQQT